MAKTNPFEFLQQVRTETSKVTWPTRKETMITTVMVLLMVVASALFFLAADQILSWVVGLVLGLG
ncbi:MAG: preprotein translocase subunit SecE [Hyphomicrobiales bacterium]|nr:preprotein translocase subunit SecE [Hyphomicrobiales bacterium]